MGKWPPDGGDGSCGAYRDGNEGLDNVIVLPSLSPRPESSAPFRTGSPDDAEDGIERLDARQAPDPHVLDAAVEALLFASDAPLTQTSIDAFLGHPGIAEVGSALSMLRTRYDARGGGIRLVQVAHGWQLRTDPRFGRWVAAMLGGKPLKLSRAALEVLAVVAYRQPVSKADVDDLRGVDSGGVLRMLVERGLVVVTGRRDEPGRPLIYGSSTDFLSTFGLRDLSDLPTLRDLHELQHDDPRLGPLPQDPSTPRIRIQQPLPLPQPQPLRTGKEPADPISGQDDLYPDSPWPPGPSLN